MAITKVTSSVLSSGSATDGYVLTADGSGNSAWEEVAGGGTTINNNADNRIITGSNTADTLEGESTLTYTTGALSVTGSGDTSISINTGNDSGDNSVINFGDTADADVGFINYDHGTNKMQFSANSVYAGTAYPQLEIGNAANTTSGALLQVTNYGNIGFGRTPQYYGSEFYADFQAGPSGGCHITLLSNGGSGGRLHLVGGVSAHSIGSDTSTQINFTMNESAIGNINTNGVLNIDVNDTSDQGLKENITSITDGTTVIKALRPVAFDWKEITAQNEKGETTVKAARRGQHGFLAQEIEMVLPNAVEGTDWVEGNHFTESKSMNSAAVLAHAVKAIQELEARIETLENA
jgi:hypothetical protein